MNATVRVAALCVSIALPSASLAQQLTPLLAAQRVEALEQQQCQIQRDIRVIPDGPGAQLAAETATVRQLKGQMFAELVGLEAQMDVIQELQSASTMIREKHVKEIVRYSANSIGRWTNDGQQVLEAEIQQLLGELRVAVAAEQSPVQCSPTGPLR